LSIGSIQWLGCQGQALCSYLQTLTPQPLNAQPEGGNAEERRWQGSSKRADPATFMKNYLSTQPYRSIRKHTALPVYRQGRGHG